VFLKTDTGPFFTSLKANTFGKAICLVISRSDLEGARLRPHFQKAARFSAITSKSVESGLTLANYYDAIAADHRQDPINAI